MQKREGSDVYGVYREQVPFWWGSFLGIARTGL